MTLPILDKLHPASFRGAVFLITGDATTTGGRKTVSHDFVNSNNRNVEDLGKFPDIFTINGIIDSENYEQNRDRLIAALNRPGPGILVHPFHGEVNVTLSGTYNLVQNTNNLGIAEFTMTFETSQKEVLPQAALSSLSIVSKQTDLLNSSLVTDVEEGFKTTNSFKRSIQAGSRSPSQ